MYLKQENHSSIKTSGRENPKTHKGTKNLKSKSNVRMIKELKSKKTKKTCTRKGDISTVEFMNDMILF